MHPTNPKPSPGEIPTVPYKPDHRPQSERPPERRVPTPPDTFQPPQIPRRPVYTRTRPRRRRWKIPPIKLGCAVPFLMLICLGVILAGYLFIPSHTNVLLMGIDYVDPWSAAARTDSLILFTFNPWKASIGMLSIPRDLWVTIPGVGEDRINTAHFYAEGLQPGSGPAATMEVVSLNFKVDIDHYLRIRFEGFREIVDAMGGMDLVLPEPMAGYPAGKVHLNGKKALAFVRDRSNSDDFFRMSQGQVMLKGLLKNLLHPLKWPRLPAVTRAFFNSVDSNIPPWVWPRLAIALLRAGPNGIQSAIITREMVNSYVTDQGAMVLLPNWAAIRPMVMELFGD